MDRSEFLKRTLAAPIAAVVGLKLVEKQKWEWKEHRVGFSIDPPMTEGSTFQYDQEFVIDREYVNKNNFTFLQNHSTRSMILKEAGEELVCGDLVRLGEDNRLYRV